ncbi:MAG: 5'/3'-nucleotidase SurE [Endomicrobium sp.]|jgi:5'-nucleotidase|nr:5'/3'-nucleotidase SurE [Endomicrobium sp.]
MFKILISNDDGAKGPGLRPLIKELSKIAKVYVIVPKSQMSGIGHGITLVKYKKFEKIEKDFYAIKNGTPADCVKYGLNSFLKDKIDLVVSGINTGPNLGRDVIYSGTVAAAREGALRGIPSLAVSAAEMDATEYEHSAIITKKIAETVLLKRKKLFKNTCLNINIPKNYKGIKVVPLGRRVFDEYFKIIADKKLGFVYKLSEKNISCAGKKNKGTDVDVVDKGYISVTPLKLDQTDFDLVEKIKL